MINLSLNSGSFATDWKLALVRLLLKPKMHDVKYNNFRPVSNLPYVSKLAEKAAAVQLTEHMTTNNLHLKLQSAYKEHHSTESALLKVTQDILTNMEERRVTLLVLLDLSAAFDTVHDQVLLDRLQAKFGVVDKAVEVVHVLSCEPISGCCRERWNFFHLPTQVWSSTRQLSGFNLVHDLHQQVI